MLKSKVAFLVILTLSIAATTRKPAAGQATMSGSQEALAAADRLLEQLGGRSVWAKVRTLHVRERAFHPRYGGPLQADFWRDLESRSWLLRSRAQENG